MKLTRRLNVILLPVILLVFSLAGAVVFNEYSKLKQVQLRNYWQQQLEYVTKGIELERRSFKATLSEVLNSGQMIRYLTAGNANEQVFALEESLHRLIARARNHVREIEQIQLLSSDGTLLISADNQNPLDEPVAIALPTDYIDQISGSRAALSQFKQQDDSALSYTIAFPFNAGLLLDEPLAEHDVNYVIAILEGRLNSLHSISRELQQQFGSGFQLQFFDGSQIANSDLFVPSKENGSGPIKVMTNADDYQLRLTISEAALASQRNYVFWRTFITTSLLSLISFLLLRSLIRQQIVSPINNLTQAVMRSQKGDDVHLKKLPADNEVASLNNAYLGLLDRVEQMASSDPLTGLANRRSFEHWLDRMLTRPQAAGRLMALLYIDLDNFKRVNDQYGHAVGDLLLQQFSHHLQYMVRPQDGLGHAHKDESCARLAGDEFALLLTNLDNADQAAAIAARIQECFNQGIEVEGLLHGIQSSIGIVLCPDEVNDANALLVNAEAAMRQAKLAGKNQYQFFSADIAAKMRKNREIERLLTDALANDQFELAFMPIYQCNSLAVSGVEVLLRCPTLTQLGIGPDQFIPVAESRGLIREIDLWVIEHAFKQMSTMQHGMLSLMAINISAMELNNGAFAAKVGELIALYNIDPAKIELEITETSIIADDDNALDILNQIKALGVSLSLDDFGTGFTAFSQLANCPVDCLKIDRSFVNNVGKTSRNKRPMLDMILSLGRLYELRVIAEGVETQEQLDYLQQQGCDQVQGFYLSKPLPLAQFRQLLQQQNCQRQQA